MSGQTQCWLLQLLSERQVLQKEAVTRSVLGSRHVKCG